MQNNVCSCFPTFIFFKNSHHSKSDIGQWKNEPMSQDFVEPASKEEFFWMRCGCLPLMVMSCRCVGFRQDENGGVLFCHGSHGDNTWLERRR